ncbi:MAG: GDSL-type esterase/lipase family protein [Kovacikia sp.]
MVAKRGGLSYVTNVIARRLKKTSDVAPYHSPFYFHRLTQFEYLPLRSFDIVFLGDSLTNEAEWSELFQDSKIKNRGISGDTTEGILKRLHPILNSKPQKVFLMIGINDIKAGVPVAEIIQNYAEILTTIQHQVPATKVFIESLLPLSSKLFGERTNQTVIQVNEQLKQLAEKFSYPYIDLYSQFLSATGELDPHYSLDGLHLNGPAYDRWRQLIKEYVLS